MPIKDPIVRKEYARISMLIKYARDRGGDISQLLEQRKSIISGIRYNGIIKGISKDNIIPQSGVSKSGIRIKPQSVANSHQLNEIKTTLTELQRQLQTLTSELPNYHTQISNELTNFRQEVLSSLSTKREKNKPTKIFAPKAPKQVIAQPPQKRVFSPRLSQSPALKKTDIKFDTNLLVKIQSFLTENPQSFSSFAQLVREAFSAYQNGMKINENEPLNPREKKTIRMNQELYSFYHNLPEGKKYQTLNQILAAFLVVGN